MRVVFTKNLGSIDAIAHDLDFRKCVAGAEVAVESSVGERLVKRRLATAVVDFKAVPPIELKTAETIIEPKQEEAPQAPQPVIQPKKSKEK